jgi:succinoglycan biosynthesis protein ExoA
MSAPAVTVETPRFVTVIVPCRNEEQFIGPCLDSLVQTTYPTDRLEILVVDGMSADRTREIVAGYRQKHPFIRLVDNPRFGIPFGVNIGIRDAKGDAIMIAGAHATYNEEYIVRCVDALFRYDADNVGGVRRIAPRNNTFFGHVIAILLTHRFGAGAPSYHHAPDKPREVDTIWGGCFRRDVFERIGLYDENLARAEDREFNQRLRDSGGKILQVPGVECCYLSRSNPTEFVFWMWQVGKWPFLGSRRSHRRIWGLRNLVPPAFVIALFASLLGAALVPNGWWLPLPVILPYLAVALVCSFDIAVKRKDPRYLFVMPIMFGFTHVFYGIGSLWGLVEPISDAEPKKLAVSQ